MACGTPVVATAVGGIPEQIKSLPIRNALSVDGVRSYEANEATGMLTPPANAEAFGDAIHVLLGDKELRLRLSNNAAADARRRFDQTRHVNDYLDWYSELSSYRKHSVANSSKKSEQEFATTANCCAHA